MKCVVSWWKQTWRNIAFTKLLVAVEDENPPVAEPVIQTQPKPTIEERPRRENKGPLWVEDYVVSKTSWYYVIKYNTALVVDRRRQVGSMYRVLCVSCDTTAFSVVFCCVANVYWCEQRDPVRHEEVATRLRP